MGDLFGPLLENSAFRITSYAVGVVCAVAVVGILVWIYRDADDRDAKPIMWVVIGAFVALLGAAAGYLGQSVVGFASVGLAMLTLVGAFSFVYRVMRPVDLADDAIEREMSMHLLKVELENKSCPRCSHAIEEGFLLCPSCGLELRRPCAYCGRPNKLNWAACPYCGTRKGA